MNPATEVSPHCSALPARGTPSASAPHRSPVGPGAQTVTVTVAGRYATDTWVQGATYSAAAYVVVPKVAGGLWYTVSGQGFDDPAYYGQRVSLTFSAAGAVPRPNQGHGDTRVQDRGDTLWACLSSMSGPLANLGDALPYFDARFRGMTVEAIVSVRATPD